jgi:ribonucleoside-diphosphate reductase alpha chain
MELKEWLPLQIGQDIWTKKYQYDNETLDQWFQRVSGNNPEYKKLIVDKKFLPAGRILSNRGLNKLKRKVSYSNCYVITPPEDNIESIFECAKKLARTYSYGGGCGTDISKLRPQKAEVNNAARTTSGACSFMDLYSLVTELIGQNGRRGALMLSLDCHHPDIEEFIDIKKDLNKVTKANISIKITDDFMHSVRNNSEFNLEFYVPETKETITKKVYARSLFRKIADSNWQMAEPGFLFWDTIKRWNLLSEDKEFEFAGVNPCAEEPLPSGGSCLLGSINLSAFVSDSFTDAPKFDYSDYRGTIQKSVRLLNEIMLEGLPLHPLEEQRQSVNNWRQIGLGIMGIADMLIKLKTKYGSTESINFCDYLGKMLIDTAISESALIAKDQGSYPKYKKESIFNSKFFIDNTTDETKSLVEKYGLAHSQLTTIAPTGSLSTMLGISGGIEPIYNYSYIRKTESLHDEDKYYTVYTPIVKEYMSFSELNNESELPEFFTNAMKLKYTERIALQAVWQKHIDASISSTVNVPESFTIEETEKLYELAWSMGLKGITIFRDNCSRTGILTNDKECQEYENTQYTELPRGFIEEVPEGLTYRKYKLKNGCGNLYFFVGVDECEGKIYDVFTNTDSLGGCTINTQANSRLLSAGLRGGVPIGYLIEQLEKSGSCASYQALRGRQSGMTQIKNMIKNNVSKDIIHNIDKLIGTPISQGKSCPSSIAVVLKNIIKEF